MVSIIIVFLTVLMKNMTLFLINFVSNSCFLFLCLSKAVDGYGKNGVFYEKD